MQAKIFDEILSYFSEELKSEFIKIDSSILNEANEIRIRVDKPIIISCVNKEYFLERKVTLEELLRIIEKFSESSIYSFQNEINAGFITIKGGHRVGIVGTCVIENDEIKNIKYISSINIRIAREVKGCAEELIKKICDKSFENTIIISAPGCGKTTLLRDAIRLLSDGFENIRGTNIGVADERSEIAAVYKGIPQNNIGIRTDVISNCKKDMGMRMLIRSMGPRVIATDEVGSNEDINAIFEACNSGVKLLVTAHGYDLNDVAKVFKENNVFKNIVVLDNEGQPGNIKRIYRLEDLEYVAIN